MSRGFRWTLGLVLVASAIGGLVLLWPTETKRVTRMVERFAADASFKPGDGNIVRLEQRYTKCQQQPDGVLLRHGVVVADEQRYS